MNLSVASQVRKVGLSLLVTASIAVLSLVTTAGAQTAGRANTPAAGPPARQSAPAAGKPDASLLQLMRGILYPASNVLFAAQDDLGKFTPPEDPSTSPNPITSTYGGWDAVQNASLAIAEATRLLTVPGRVCSNDRPAPVQRADYEKFSDNLRQVALKAYQAAQTKSTDKMVDAASDLADACSACHTVYREKAGGEKDRCLP
jgi:hypothetical protein